MPSWDAPMRANLPWSEEEIERLKEVYPTAFLQEMQDLFPSRRVSAVTQMANRLRVRRGARHVWFPRVYDDVADGNYVSGLVDGEGSFKVSIVNRRGHWNFN